MIRIVGETLRIYFSLGGVGTEIFPCTKVRCRIERKHARAGTAAIAVLLVAAACATAQAADVDWTGAYSEYWLNGDNWQYNSVPGVNDNVYLNTVLPNPTVVSAATGKVATLTIGFDNTGALTLQGGSTISSTAGVIASEAGSTGTVIVTGMDSEWMDDGVLYVGSGGTGAMTIEKGGAVRSRTGAIANDGATGTVIVTGADSHWAVEGNLYVGSGGRGVLTIADGGTVSASGQVIIANGSGSTGMLAIGAGVDGSGAPLAPDAPGTLETDTVGFSHGIGRIVFNHSGNPDGSDYVFSPAISGKDRKSVV